MLEIVQTTPFQAYVACSAALVLNLLFLASATAANRSKAKFMLNPEDEKVNPGGSVVTEEDPAARFVRAHRNALENIPPFLAAGLLYVLVSPPTTVAIALLAAFTFFRWTHSLAYIKGAQPWRTLSFALAAVSLLAIAIHTVVIVFTA